MAEEIKLGDLVTYIPNVLLHNNMLQQRYYPPEEDARQLWLVIGIHQGGGMYNLMKYDSIEDIKCWHNRANKIQTAWSGAVRKEVFQTHLMNAELHDWFLEKSKGVVSAG